MSEGELFPFEFFVAGTPKSVQATTKSLQRWRGFLQESARSRVSQLVDQSWLDQRPLALTIYYFASAPMGGDVDNIIKPIMDALIGIVYPDDQIIERVLVQRFEPFGERSFDEPGEVLAAALDADAPIVYIRVDDDCAWRRN